jgi:hypothetical protein
MNVFIIIVVALAIFTIFTVLEIYNNANRTEGFEDLENTLNDSEQEPNQEDEQSEPVDESKVEINVLDKNIFSDPKEVQLLMNVKMSGNSTITPRHKYKKDLIYKRFPPKFKYPTPWFNEIKQHSPSIGI